MKTCQGCTLKRCCPFSDLDKGCQNHCTEDKWNNRKGI